MLESVSKKMKLKELRKEEDNDEMPPPPLSLANVLLLRERPPKPWINRRTATAKSYSFGLIRDSLAVYTATFKKKNLYKDWSDDDEKDGNALCKKLPVDLLGEIGKRLSSRLDILRFRSVCKIWRSSLPCPPRFPLRVPPLPRDVDPEEEPCVIVEVNVYYQSNKKSRFIVLEELDQGGKFHARRRYEYPYSSYEARVLCPAISFTSWWSRLPSPYDRLSFVSKSYHLRRALDHRYSHRYVERIVITSSAGDGVNPSYAKQSDLSVVALVCEGAMKGRLALLRIGGSSETWGWDTDFCTRLFFDLASYKGRVCGLETQGSVVVMDFDDSGLLGVTQITSCCPEICNRHNSLMYEDCGELYLVQAYQMEWTKYKLASSGKKKKAWVRVHPQMDALVAHYTRRGPHF